MFIETRETDELPLDLKKLYKIVPGKKVNVVKITKVDTIVEKNQIESEMNYKKEPSYTREIVLIENSDKNIWDAVTEKETNKLLHTETEIRTDPNKTKTYQFENQFSKNGSVEKETYQMKTEW